MHPAGGGRSVADFETHPPMHMQRLINPSRLRAAPSIRLLPFAPQSRRYASMDGPAPAAGAAATDTEAAAVANKSGITPQSLSTTLKEKIQAQHVDIEDMSGTYLRHESGM